jgi:hypothetical protein
MARRPGTRGFWQGLLVGFMIAAAMAVTLGYLFPPLRPPQVTPASLVAPAAPGAPGVVAGPPAPGNLLPAVAPGPLIADIAAPAPPSLTDGAPSLLPGN